MSRGPGRVQRWVLDHLAALEGEWCPLPDLAAAYAIAHGIALETRPGRRIYQRSLPWAPRSTEESVYRATRVLADRGLIERGCNGYGLVMDSGHSSVPPWLFCARHAAYPDPGWVALRLGELGEEWRERCRTPARLSTIKGQVLSVAGRNLVASRNTYTGGAA